MRNTPLLQYPELHDLIPKLLKGRKMHRDELCEYLKVPRTTMYEYLCDLISIQRIQKVLFNNRRRGRPKTYYELIP